MTSAFSLTLLIAIAVVNIALGLFLLRKPTSAFEIQKKFYEKINWRMEPISVDREIRNTRVMGIFLIAVTVALVIAGSIGRFR